MTISQSIDSTVVTHGIGIKKSNRTLPLVASIRYAAGELPGAPMLATGGHLVVVTGVDGEAVLVNDPAAPYHGTVSRRYPLAAFSRAWFRHRGAVYIVSP